MGAVASKESVQAQTLLAGLTRLLTQGINGVVFKNDTCIEELPQARQALDLA